MAEAAADVRLFDREAVITASDVWDNNLFPLFWAATTSSAGQRERRATTVLEWMAGFSERRRRWMTEQATIAGYDLEALLSPAKPDIPGRDHRGHVMPPQKRITGRNMEELDADYDLTTASVRHLRAERAGTRLSAFLQLVVARTFVVDTSAPPALLDLWLDGVTDITFRLSDIRGTVLDARAPETEISLGPGGRIRAAGGEYRLDDRSWHLSAAGRRADAVTPARTRRSGRPRRPPGGDLGPDAHAAAALLRHAMLEFRSVRYAARADHVPVLMLCRAFSGAGEAILSAGSQDDAGRREAAFQDVIRVWADQGGPELRHWFSALLGEHAGDLDIIGTPPASEGTPSSLTEGSPVSGTPAQAALVMAAWTAAHTHHGTERPSAAQLQLALPPRAGKSSAQGSWRLRTVGCTEPKSFRLNAEAFQGPGPLVQVGKPTGARSLDLHEGALFVAAETGWSAP